MAITVTKRWLREAREQLLAHQAELNALNVRPVPDHDTGTNLLVTVEAALAAEDPLIGARTGAAGGSGAILAAWLTGYAGRPDVSRGLTAAATAATKAVGEVLPASMVTVAHAVGGAANLAEAYRRASEAVVITGRHGVADAGAVGLVLMLRAGAIAAGDEPAPLPVDLLRAPCVTATSGANRFEITYRFEGETAALRAALHQIGDAVVVADAVPSRVHVHSTDAGAAIEAGLVYGSIAEIAIATLPGSGGVTLIVCGDGEGFAEWVTAAGGVPLPAQPGGDRLREAIGAAPSAVIFPNDPALFEAVNGVAAQARLSGRRVAVVHSASPVQALAALAVHDPAAEFEADVVAMAEAASATRWGCVTVAPFRAWTVAGLCEPGDVLAIVAGEVARITDTVAAAALDVVDRLLDTGGEQVTLLTGAVAEPEVSALVVEHVRSRWPYVSVETVDGGQPLNVLVVGVE